ncbi:MAG TPA: energy transducer TonB [Pyrinomonadaceae bacterium]|nr:energy transducer TonB [Pyrinomonadaceae bacterium]
MNLFISSRLIRLYLQVFLLSALLASFGAEGAAQTPAAPAPSPTEEVKTSTDSATTPPAAEPDKSQVEADRAAAAIQTRITRARALIAAHRLDIAASELESVRGAVKDDSVRNITSIMLMSVYLEDGNYGRAEALLEETFQARGAQKDESLGTYFALAGQAVNGTRSHLARYRNFGISTASATLPAEVEADLTRLRSLLERMIYQARDISDSRRAYDSLSLLEDVLGLRLSLATSAEDQAKWETDYAAARESLASSQTQIASLGGIPPLRPGKKPSGNPASPSPYSTKRPADSNADTPAREKSDAHAERNLQQPVSSAVVANPASAAADKPAETSDNEAGSLTAFATRKVVPRYPPIAKSSGSTGLVRVYVIVEGGKVIAISKSEGPVLLRQAAEEAARQWLFQSVSIEGRPARLNGYIDFNFTL